MQRIGAMLAITGLLGIPVVGLTRTGLSATACVLLWVALGLSVAYFGARKHKWSSNDRGGLLFSDALYFLARVLPSWLIKQSTTGLG